MAQSISNLPPQSPSLNSCGLKLVVKNTTLEFRPSADDSTILEDEEEEQEQRQRAWTDPPKATPDFHPADRPRCSSGDIAARIRGLSDHLEQHGAQEFQNIGDDVKSDMSDFDSMALPAPDPRTEVLPAGVAEASTSYQDCPPGYNGLMDPGQSWLMNSVNNAGAAAAAGYPSMMANNPFMNALRPPFMPGAPMQFEGSAEELRLQAEAFEHAAKECKRRFEEQALVEALRAQALQAKSQPAPAPKPQRKKAPPARKPAAHPEASPAVLPSPSPWPPVSMQGLSCFSPMQIPMNPDHRPHINQAVPATSPAMVPQGFSHWNNPLASAMQSAEASWGGSSLPGTPNYCPVTPPMMPNMTTVRPRQNNSSSSSVPGRGAAAKQQPQKKQQAQQGAQQVSASAPPMQVIPGDTRTTLMLRNLPNDYSRDMLLALLDVQGFARCYDFIYMPVDFHKRAGLGYAFVNMVTNVDAVRLHEKLMKFCDWETPSQKVLDICWSEPSQGLEAHVERYRNSPVMHPDVEQQFKPLLFQNGVPIQFPGPTKRIRQPRLKHGNHKLP